MIQRHRAHDIRTTGECNNADAVVRPSFNKFACDFADRIYPGRFLSTDRKIFCQHRPGDIEHEHDIDPAGFDLRETFAKLRTRECNDENRERRKQQRPKDLSEARRALFSNDAKKRCR